MEKPLRDERERGRCSRRDGLAPHTRANRLTRTGRPGVARESTPRLVAARCKPLKTGRSPLLPALDRCLCGDAVPGV